MWQEKAQHYERAEWKKKSEGKLVLWTGCLQELWKSFLSQTHNWKSGSDQTQNYLLKAFPATQRH